MWIPHSLHGNTGVRLTHWITGKENHLRSLFGTNCPPGDHTKAVDRCQAPIHLNSVKVILHLPMFSSPQFYLERWKHILKPIHICTLSPFAPTHKCPPTSSHILVFVRIKMHMSTENRSWCSWSPFSNWSSKWNFGSSCCSGRGSRTHLELHSQEWRQPEQRMVLAAQASWQW